MMNGTSDSAEHSSKTYFQMTGEERLIKIARQVEESNKRVGHLNELDGYDCPICNNRGRKSSIRKTERIINGEPDYEEVESDCICKPIRNSLRRIKKSGLANVMEKYTFQSYETVESWQQNLKDKAQRFIENCGGVFFIGGQSGSGKTHICTAIVGDLLRKGKAAYYMLWEDEIIKLKANKMDDAKYQQQMNLLKTIDVLYIDDFFKPVEGNPKPTPADIKIAYELINYRYINGSGATIISSEHYIQEILDMDEATGGRLIEYAGEYITNIKRDRARNYRLKNLGMM